MPSGDAPFWCISVSHQYHLKKKNELKLDFIVCSGCPRFELSAVSSDVTGIRSTCESVIQSTMTSIATRPLYF